MKIYKPASTFNTTRVWSDITNIMTAEGPFRITDVIGRIKSIQHLANGTQRDIIRYVLQTVLAENEDQVRQINKKLWSLAPFNLP